MFLFSSELVLHKDSKTIPRLAKQFGISTKSMTFLVSALITLTGLAIIVGIGFPLYYVAQTLRIRLEAREAAEEALTGAAPQRILQPAWDFLLHNTFGLIHSPLLPGLLSMVYYFFGCVPAAACDGIIACSMQPAANPVIRALGRFLSKFKIQDEKTSVPEAADFMRALSYNVITQIALYGPLVLIQYFLQGPWLFRLYLDANSSKVKSPYPSFSDFCLFGCSRMEHENKSLLPSLAPTVWEFGFHLLLCVVIFDAAYFAWHKIHHMSVQLYGFVHSFHHQYASPFSLTTQYIHPCELLAVGGYTMLLPICLGLHPLTELVWLVLSVQLSIDAHTGFEWPFGLENFIPFYGGTLRSNCCDTWRLS
eukprot:INCI16382.7.p1 GENE.INCI16382.7~~INCI16382.7.p1  ORF type:complete len:365 (-),score=36.99 INCI16382.7:505-1599(-)